MDVNHPPWIQGEGLLVCGGVCAARRGDIKRPAGPEGKRMVKKEGWEEEEVKEKILLPS